MKSSYKIGFAAICGSAATLALSPIPAHAWGPVYEFGNCIIDTGARRETFECYVSTGGEPDGFSMNIIRAVSNNPSHDPLVGTYRARNSGSSQHVTFNWSNGTEEQVQASDFSNPEDWAFWTQDGCGIGFQRSTLEL
ncbi:MULTISPECIES: hypothetical protein [unclassified Leptolyngbya]|uniref:hypothetical protein n=1 Tax=unclassified Leptolyngbya TaxID=2650499 RepID=UPI001686303B|nr:MULTISPECIES: hypothetical protein [unclassified Leptolyngbya]MBD1909363.1 hypothetical protein [Leptolyngbya sp. FACHB-8]MBD2156926.1 hypothetical protein [Leptolyngbya sp. FACHB-16]